MNKVNESSRLVDYSSDEEHDTHEAENIDKNTCPENTQVQKNYDIDVSRRKECDILPLPSEIKCMFADNYEHTVVDDPEKYGGKVRSFPHERGIWATYVFIEYNPLPEFLEMFEVLKNESKKHGITLSSVEDFHVSLSRTVKLRHHWIQPFIEALQMHLRPIFKFRIMFQSLEVYENEEKTRTFIGLKVNFGYDKLCKITQKVDTCLEEFKLPLFYKNPSFHLSCASCVGSKAAELELFMSDLNAIFQSFAELNPASRALWITDIYCKSGNKLFTVPLKS